MGRIVFRGLVGLTAVLALFVSCLAADAWGGSASQLTEERERCVQHYDPSVDYFPNKARISYATGFALEYDKHYKVLTVLTPWPGAKEHFRYVLVQCGTPRPAGFDDVKFIEVPITTVAVLSDRKSVV